MKTLGLILIAAGVLALIYGGFTYTKDTHDLDIGPLEINLEEKETVNIPVWAGVVSVVCGAGALVAASKGRSAR